LRPEVVWTDVLVVFRVNEVDNVMILDCLSLYLHLELVVRHQLKHSLGDVLVYYQVATCLHHHFLLPRTANIVVVSLLVSLLDSHLYPGRVYREGRVVVAQLSMVYFAVVGAIEKEFFKAVGEITLSFAVIDLEGSRQTDFVSFLFVGAVGDQLEDDFFRKFLLQVDFEGTNARRSTVKGAVDVVLGVEVTEDNFVSKGNVLPPFFPHDGLELLFFRLCTGSGLCFLRLDLLGVHFVVDFKGALGEHFEKGLSVVVDVNHIHAGGGEEIVFIVDLEVEVGVGVAG
jgi:hypothetical protein